MRVAWIFNKTLNDNFSMQDDSNNDGLSDELTSVSGTHSRTENGLRFHVQSTDGEFYLEQIIDNTKNYRIYFDYKGDSTVTIKRYDNADQLVDTWKNEELSSSDWSYKLYAYTANASVVKLRIYFTCGLAETLYLDNLAIITNSVNVRYNPSAFNYDLSSRGEIVENIDNNIQFIQPYKNKYNVEGLKSAWAWVTYAQKAELDELINEKVLIRTHENQVWSAFVMKINYDYETQREQLDQTYHCEIQMKFF